MRNLIDVYEKELICNYKGETYSVRDNGAVKRHSREFGKKRILDDIWTFGKVYKQKGYLFISDVQVHRIIATAFHGEPPSKNHVVDHINTNKQDNRPENLRWVTRLENIILNPITCKKIEYITGKPIEYILQHIEILHEIKLPQEYSWMRTVTKEESQNCYENFLRWTLKRNTPSITKEKRKLDEQIYKKRTYTKTSLKHLIDKSSNPKGIKISNPKYANSSNTINPSLTTNAMVKGKMIQSKFPCCPNIISDTPLQTYINNLLPGNIYLENNTYKQIVLEAVLYNEKIIVKSQSFDKKEAIKPWSVGIITFENDSYIHSLYKTCFEKKSADKYFTILQDKEWTGGDVLDDYC